MRGIPQFPLSFVAVGVIGGLLYRAKAAGGGRGLAVPGEASPAGTTVILAQRLAGAAPTIPVSCEHEQPLHLRARLVLRELDARRARRPAAAMAGTGRLVARESVPLRSKSAQEETR